LIENEPLVTEHLAFQETIVKGGQLRLASLQEGLDVVKICEALLESTGH
jgi:hypothetical protein